MKKFSELTNEEVATLIAVTINLEIRTEKNVLTGDIDWYWFDGKPIYLVEAWFPINNLNQCWIFEEWLKKGSAELWWEYKQRLPFIMGKGKGLDVLHAESKFRVHAFLLTMNLCE